MSKLYDDLIADEFHPTAALILSVMQAWEEATPPLERRTMCLKEISDLIDVSDATIRKYTRQLTQDGWIAISDWYGTYHYRLEDKFIHKYVYGIEQQPEKSIWQILKSMW